MSSSNPSSVNDDRQRRSWFRYGLVALGALVGVCLVVVIAVALFSDEGGDDNDGTEVASEATTLSQPESTNGESLSVQPTAQSTQQSATEAGAEQLTETQVVATTASSTPSPTPAATPTFAPTPSATAQPEPTPAPSGKGRTNPLPIGEIGQTSDWEVQILEVIRGDAAWQRIIQANQFNAPAREGYEYILFNARVKYIGASAEAQRVDALWFRSTGDARVKYNWVSIVQPEPALQAELFSGGEATGWVVVTAKQGEGNMIAIFEPIISLDEGDALFFALDAGAAVPPLDGRSADQNELGFDRANPVQIGDHVVGDVWEIWVIEAVRGEEALSRLKTANQFNEDPAAGMEYVLVHIGARHAGVDAGSEHIDWVSFKSTGDNGRVYDNPALVAPKPTFDFDVYAGGEVDGWLAVQVAVGEQNIKLVYEPLFSLSAQPRFFALQ